MERVIDRTLFLNAFEDWRYNFVMSDILKPNYDDFYKFSVSAGFLFVLICILVASYFFVREGNTFFGTMMFYIYFGFAVLGAVLVSFGLRKWYKNQKLLDRRLRAEVHIVELERNVKRLEFKQASLEAKNPIEPRGQMFPPAAEAIPENTVPKVYENKTGRTSKEDTT